MAKKTKQRDEELESITPIDAGGKALFHHTAFRIGVASTAIIFIGIMAYTLTAPPKEETAAVGQKPRATDPAPVIDIGEETPIAPVSEPEPEEETVQGPLVQPIERPKPIEPTPASEPTPRTSPTGALLPTDPGRPVSIAGARHTPNTPPPPYEGSPSDAQLDHLDSKLAPFTVQGIQGVDMLTDGAIESVYEEAALSSSARRMLTAGAFVELTMQFAIRTDLPTTMRASVSRNVYDRNGEVSIPRGSMFIGSYGQTPLRDRVVGVWEYIQFPDGRLVPIKAHLTDRQGRVGLQGKINRSILKNAGKAILTTTVRAAAAVTENMRRPKQIVAPVPPTSTEGTDGTNVIIPPQPVIIEDPPSAGDVAADAYVDGVLKYIEDESRAVTGEGVDVYVETESGALAGAIFTTSLFIDESMQYHGFGARSGPRHTYTESERTQRQDENTQSNRRDS